MMDSNNSNTQEFIHKRTFIKWGSIAAILLTIFYYSGLYTEVRGMMKHVKLWSGLFGTEIQEINQIEGPKLNNKAYSATFLTPAGDRMAMKDYKGKVLFINIWASWCLPCIAEMPTIETLYKNVSDNKDIKFMLISVDDKRDKAIKFMKSKGFPMPIYFPDSDLPGVFKGSSIPSTYIVSKKGQIIYQKKGMADYSSEIFQDWLSEQAK